MSEVRAEPVEARPWPSGDGPGPVVWLWPRVDRPALRVWSHGAWRWATVVARQDWPDGRIACQVEVDLTGSTSVTSRMYWWPHEGLRVAHRSACAPSTGQVDQGSMPSAPPQRQLPWDSRAASMAAANASSRRRR